MDDHPADRYCGSFVHSKAGYVAGEWWRSWQARQRLFLFERVWSSHKARKTIACFVWFHGGALRFGSGALPIYDGSVSGFFTPAPDKPNKCGPMNFGLLDQVAALRRIQKNIEAIGCNPARVTIAGQSAGA